MEKEELARKVELYLKRAREDRSVKNYSINHKAHWRILSGIIGPDSQRDPLKEILRGRFIDAVAYAVQQQNFYSRRGPRDDPSYSMHGIVERLKVRTLEESGLTERVVYEEVKDTRVFD